MLFASLLLCLVTATAALDGAPAPPPRRNASGCVSFSSPPSMARTSTRAIVGLYSGSGAASVLLEDISDAVTRVLLARAGEDQDQEWQLCVDFASAALNENFYDIGREQLLINELPNPNTLQHRALSAVKRGAVVAPLTSAAVAGDVAAVEVDSLVDSAANVSACAVPSAAGRCNLRSAVSYCEWILSEQTGLACVVSLPAGETLDMDPALGELSVNNPKVNGHMAIHGNGCVVRSDPASAASSRLLSINASSSLGLSVSNMTVTGFGEDSIDGGTMMLLGLNGGNWIDISFIGTKGRNGGTLHFSSCTDVTLIGCSFTNTTALLHGGSIYLHIDNDGVSISHCIFSDTSAKLDGGSLYMYANNYGVAISNCSFSDISSGYEGGVIYLYTDNFGASISKCVFEGTSTGNDGGAIYVYQNNDGVVISDCSFSLSEAGHDGGAIYLDWFNDNIAVLRCIFTGTFAGDSGGSIYVYEDVNDMIIADCSFVDTSARLHAGSIYFFWTNNRVTISRCNFTDTSALVYGGAIHIGDLNTLLSILDCSFTNTFSEDDGGAIHIYEDNDDAAITGCTFSGTNAAGEGGAIYLHRENWYSIIADNKFTHTFSLSVGGAISMFQANEGTEISSCTFTNTSAKLSGGAIAIYEDNNAVVIQDCIFTDTVVQESGGSVYIHYNNWRLTISNCDFSDTSALHNGGAVYSSLTNWLLKILDCTISGSTSDVNGGAIYLNEDNLGVIITGCVFTDIWAGHDGGVLYVHQDNGGVKISGCMFTNTAAGYDGGAIYLDSKNEKMVISDNIFSATSAGYDGGSMYLYQNNIDADISECTFFDSSAQKDGGSIYMYQNNDDMAISHCSFSETSAGEGGGAVYLYAANFDVAVVNCDFMNSNAGKSGGFLHVYVNNDGFIVYSSSFRSGAAEDGGAIYLGNDNNNVEFFDVIFEDNSGKFSGGAVLVQSSNVNLRLSVCVFMKNAASLHGGAIAAVSANTGLSLESCILRLNSASSGGGITIGEGHATVSFLDNIIELNIGDLGGGIYVSQGDDDSVTFTRTTIRENTATSEGGGIYALFGILNMVKCSITKNSAASSGALYGRSVTAVIESTLITYNVARIAGGLYFESAISVAVNYTQFVNNSAGGAGAIGARDCEELTFMGCLFENNTGSVGYGGAFVVDNSNIDITGCMFKANSARGSGGALYLYSLRTTVSNCIFDGSISHTNGGSAIWLSTSESVGIVGNTFRNNHAPNGGGTVYWVASAMDEPSDLLSSNIFSETNSALYGSAVATDVQMLVPADKNIYDVTDYTAPVPSLEAHVVDYYGQVVKTENAVIVASVKSSEAFCFASTGYVTGGIIGAIASGVSNFTDLLAYCDPGYSMTIYLTTAIESGTFQAAAEYWFRDCITGEYWGDRVCNPCEVGTFSVTDPATVSCLSDLTQQDVCRECPDGSDSCYGSSIILSKGYWRISDKSTSTTKCPYEGSCKGGAGSGDALCADGYEGPVCGVCSEGYSFRSSTQQCQPCSDSAGLDAVTILLLVAVALIAVFVVCVLSNRKFRDSVKTMDDLYVLVFTKLGLLKGAAGDSSDEHKHAAGVLRRRFQARLKFYIIVWQVVSLLPFTLDMNFPNVYSSLAFVLNFFNLKVDVSSLVSCETGMRFDAIDNLVVQTVYPVVVAVSLYIARLVHVTWLGKGTAKAMLRVSSRYFNIFLVFTYLVLPFVSVVIFQTFSCQDVDPDNVESGSNTYMTVDYSVSCSSSKYEFGFIWAIVSIFVYPVGAPLIYFYLLYSSKDDIMNRHKASVEATVLNERLRPKQVLFEFYAPKYWFWEVVETVHRLLLTGVLVVISQGSGAQIIVGVTVALFFLKLIDVYQPYADPNVQQIRVMCQWQIYFVFFLALILKADFESVDRTALDALLVLAVIANIVWDLTNTILSCIVGRSFMCSGEGPDELIEKTENPLVDQEDSGTETMEEGVAMGDIRVDKAKC